MTSLLLKSICFLALIAFSQAGTCQFGCTSNCISVVSATYSSDPAWIIVEVSALACKGSALSWIACRNTGCSAYGPGASSSIKFDEVITATFLIPATDSTIQLQIHDGVQSGTVDCSVSNCAGGAGVGCVDSVTGVKPISGVCNVDVAVGTIDDPIEHGVTDACQVDADCASLITNVCMRQRCVLDDTTGNYCESYPAPAEAMIVCHESADLCDLPIYCDGFLTFCPPEGNYLVDLVNPCRPAVDLCDQPEYCLGDSPSCPDDLKYGSNHKCREAHGVCDEPDYCSGSSNVCEESAPLPSTVVCRSVLPGHLCDEPEYCDGISFDCPVDTFKSSNFVCREADPTLICDVAETCTGNSPLCPTDLPDQTEKVCRDVAGVCDVAEKCDGVHFNCPGDSFLSGTVCREAVVIAGTTCDKTEFCSGNSKDCPTDEFLPIGTVCRAKYDNCDVADTCTGGVACPSDQRDDYGYVYKCATTCFVCAVQPSDLSMTSSSAYSLGGCGIGTCRNIVSLSWPECVHEPVAALCPNNRGLSNTEVYQCSLETGDWVCTVKYEGSAVANGVWPWPI